MKLSLCVALVFSTVAFLAPASSDAQWLNYKTPGIPRLPDGKPNLAAPAPKTAEGKPDFSGLWRDDTSTSAAMSKAMDSLKPLPWAAAVYEKRKDNLGSDSPGTMCLPWGPLVDLGVGKVVQTPKLLLMLYNSTFYREIFMDGRELPKDPNPDWMGYSVGHWDGDTLVIESNGFNDRTWIDDNGHPHTEALRVTERIRRPDFGHLEVVRTLVDPGAFEGAWTVPVKLELDADTEPVEYICNENERDRPHLIGKASDDTSVPVAPEILAKYAGTYAFKIPETGQILDLMFRVDKDHLVLEGVGPSTPLTSVSDTEFSGSGITLKFDQADTKTLIVKTVEGDYKAIRK
jgi:hypothetical protein